MSKNTGACVPWRPQSFMYAMMWALIVVCLSLAGVLIARDVMDDTLMYTFAIALIVFVGLAILWLGLYHGGDRKGAHSLFIVLTMVGLALFVMGAFSKWYLALLMIPGLVWLLYNLAVGGAELVCNPVTPQQTESKVA